MRFVRFGPWPVRRTAETKDRLSRSQVLCDSDCVAQRKLAGEREKQNPNDHNESLRRVVRINVSSPKQLSPPRNVAHPHLTY